MTLNFCLGFGTAVRISAGLARLAGGLALVLMPLVAAMPPAAAQSLYRAAAVVNDEVISVLDVVMRTRLAIVASGLQDSPEVRSRLQQDVLRTLIDERIKLQEAERLDIAVTEEQIDQAVEMLARQNKLSRSQFLDALARNQILPSALVAEVRGEIVWRTLVDRRLRPTVDISDEEIDEMAARLARRSGRVQHRVFEIFLGVDSVLNDNDVQRGSARLIEELKQGADFGALARQFSQSATASVGGDLGWIEPEQLPEEVAEALANMRPGQIIGPVRSFGGYYILWLQDSRQISMGNATLDLKQLLIPLSGSASTSDSQAALAEANTLRASVSGCDAVDALASQRGTAAATDLGSVKLTELPREIRSAVATLPIGQASTPLRLPAGVAVLVVCGREDGGVDRERIRSNLMNRRLGMLARRYLRDLRRAANVDVRL